MTSRLSIRQGENLRSFTVGLAEDLVNSPGIEAIADISETLKVATVTE
jgi:hypothetical protein